MRRVLFITQTPEFGGAEKHLIDLVRRMDGAAQCTILCFSEDFYSQALKNHPTVRVVKLPRITKAKFRSFAAAFLRYRSDVIVMVKGIFEHYPFWAYLAARSCGYRRLVVIEHLIPDPIPGRVQGEGTRGILRRLLGWRTRYYLRTKLQGHLSHVTVCVSEAIRECLIREYGYSQQTTVTIRNGIDLRRYVPTKRGNHVTSSNTAPIKILCVARLSQVKRIDLLLRALALLAESHGNWRCDILGSGPLEEELRGLVRQLKLDEYVRFLGQQEDVRPFLAAADLFVLPSEKEGLPLALLEAMASGVPPVVTEVGGTGEVVVHGQSGLLVKAGSTDELERAIAYLLVHHEERRRMGEAAHLHAKRFFDIEDSMARLKQIVLSC
jgi:glycosyltransferase involved in cell wall biosynthesis